MNSGISGYTLEAPFSILIDNTDKDDSFIEYSEKYFKTKNEVRKAILNIIESSNQSNKKIGFITFYYDKEAQFHIHFGDILCWHNCIGFVKFSDSLRAYVVQVVKKGKYIQTPLLNSVCYFAKIIGNIHENPELLEIVK